MAKRFTLPDSMIAAAILGGSLIIGSLVIGLAWQATEDEEGTITVTGIAKQPVTSDTAQWYFDFSREVTKPQVRDAYVGMSQDEGKVRAFLKQSGIEDKDIQITPVSIEEIYQYEGNVSPEDTKLRQSVTVVSNDVEGITTLSSKIDQLLSTGVNVSSQRIDYLYSKLDEAQAEALSDAIENARSSAQKLDLPANQRLNDLQSMVVKSLQLLPKNSSTTPDYTTIDTTTIEKELRVVVEATYKLD